MARAPCAGAAARAGRRCATGLRAPAGNLRLGLDRPLKSAGPGASQVAAAAVAACPVQYGLRPLLNSRRLCPRPAASCACSWAYMGSLASRAVMRGTKRGPSVLVLEPGAVSGAEGRADRRNGGPAQAGRARKDPEEAAAGEPGGLGMITARRGIAACDGGLPKQSGKGCAQPTASPLPRSGAGPRPQWMRGCRLESQPRDPAAALGRMRAACPPAGGGGGGSRGRRRILPAAGLAGLGDDDVRAGAGLP